MRLCLLFMLIATSMVTSAYGDMMQTGTVENGYVKDSGTWNLHAAASQDAGGRYFLQHVDFQQPFTTTQPPIVLVMLSGVDSDANVNERIVVTSENVTNNGFNVRYTTWGNTLLYGAWVTWIAIPQSQALYFPAYSSPSN
jgi:hypothetical protein